MLSGSGVLDLRGSSVSELGDFTVHEFADPFVAIFIALQSTVNVWGMTRAEAEAAIIFACG